MPSTTKPDRDLLAHTVDVAQEEFLLLLEEFGALTVHLREARDNLKLPTLFQTQADLEEALAVLGTIESLASRCGATIAKVLP